MDSLERLCAMEEVAEGISHNLNNILATILMSADFPPGRTGTAGGTAGVVKELPEEDC